jgi:ABC-type multidrug transport system fused ATPase/permease subunit
LFSALWNGNFNVGIFPNIQEVIFMFMGFLKRFAPFLITFALGLFIASFFVSIVSPRFNFRRNRAMRQCQEMQKLRYENEQLRQELQNQQTKTVVIREVRNDFDSLVPPPPPMPVKPVAVEKIR